MTAMTPLPSLVRASAQDAGDRSMRAAGRTVWGDDDWDASVAEFDRLRSALFGDGTMGCIRFSYFEAYERARRLTIFTTAKELAAISAEIDAAMTA